MQNRKCFKINIEQELFVCDQWYFRIVYMFINRKLRKGI